MKTILITGAAGNLGKAVVDRFLREGHRVIAVDSPGRIAKSEVKGELIPVEADLLLEKAIGDQVATLANKYQSIDAAVLLAGGYAGGSVSETDSAGLKKMYSLNFETAYNVARPVFMQMSKQPEGGRIVLIGARTALIAKDGKGSLAYALSKSLIFKLADFLNAEGGARNIVTTVVVPSTIDTPANRSSMPQADVSKWVKPEKIADVIHFVVTESGSVLRETVLKVYGNA